MTVSGASASASSPFVASESFSREYGCTQDEWLRWMPEAVHGHAWTQPQTDSLVVVIGSGTLHLEWKVLPPRSIALIRLPRMTVNFRFSGVNDDESIAFMKRFDLHLQRGGG